MPLPDPSFTVRAATLADARVMAVHRVSMFRDMGRPMHEGAGDQLIAATVSYLLEAIPRGEYLAWLAEDPAGTVVGGAGVQLRRILPRLLDDGAGLEPGPEALIVNVYVERTWRRRGVAAAVMQALLGAVRARGIRRVVLHASPEGRSLYERLGFVASNEMRYSPRD